MTERQKTAKVLTPLEGRDLEESLMVLNDSGLIFEGFISSGLRIDIDHKGVEGVAVANALNEISHAVTGYGGDTTQQLKFSAVHRQEADMTSIFMFTRSGYELRKAQLGMIFSYFNLSAHVEGGLGITITQAALA